VRAGVMCLASKALGTDKDVAGGVDFFGIL